MRLSSAKQSPGVSLLKLDKSERVRLSELNRAQPVVLIFGSYKSLPGPFGFKPEQLGIALAQTLGRTEGGLGR
jgi:hypothetical protein